MSPLDAALLADDLRAAQAWAVDDYFHYDPPGHSWYGPSRLAWLGLTEDICKRCGVRRFDWEAWMAGGLIP